MSVAEDPLCRGWVQPFGEHRQNHGDLVRGGLQTIQRGVSSRTERRAARLTANGLDRLGTAMRAITNQRVDLSIGDGEVRALPIGTGKALGIHPIGGSSPAFDLRPGTHKEQCTGYVRRVTHDEIADAIG